MIVKVLGQKVDLEDLVIESRLTQVLQKSVKLQKIV
jgi:hypothetical protein